MNSEKNLDRIFEYINVISEACKPHLQLSRPVVVSEEAELISLKINGDYLNEFKKTISQVENKIISDLHIKENNLNSHCNRCIEYDINSDEVFELRKEIESIKSIFKGLNYTKSNNLDKALKSYCESIEKNSDSLFSYLSLASTINYLSNLNKKLKIVGLSVNTTDLNESLYFLNKFFYKDKQISYTQNKEININQAFFEQVYNGILKSLANILLKRNDFENNLLEMGKSANEVFTISEDIVEKLYIVKRTKKSNLYKKGNLELEFQILAYFNLINGPIFDYVNHEYKDKPKTPWPIKVIPNFDKEYDYLILERKRGQNLLSLLNQKRSFDKAIKKFIKETAKIHANAPIHLIKKRKYFTKKEDFETQLKSYCNNAFLSKNKTKNLMSLIEPIIEVIVNSQDFGFVKDANLENAIYTNDCEIISIDFEEVKYAPLHYDLTKMLIFSFHKKNELLEDYIREYNFSLIGSQDNMEKLIHDNEDFKFTFLNYTIFEGVLTYLNPKYETNLKIKKQALDNAIASIDELLTKYDCGCCKDSYSRNNWYKKPYSQGEKVSILKLCDVLKDFRGNLG